MDKKINDLVGKRLNELMFSASHDIDIGEMTAVFNVLINDDYNNYGIFIDGYITADIYNYVSATRYNQEEYDINYKDAVFTGVISITDKATENEVFYTEESRFIN
jgi:hypothetical protein